MKHCSKYLRQIVALSALLFTLLLQVAHAHKSSDAYLLLDLQQNKSTIVADVAIRDLQNAQNLDTNLDGKITWRELVSNPLVDNYIHKSISFSNSGNPCQKTLNSTEARERQDGFYLSSTFTLHCTGAINNLTLRYSLFSGIDTQHRGLMRIKNENSEQLQVHNNLGIEKLLVQNETLKATSVIDYMSLGMFHIWEGWDHLLFLITLLLPSVLIRRSGAWIPTPNVKTALTDVGIIVTTFTIGHSVTLSLVSLNLLPGGFPGIEPLIALSVALAAINNVYPVLTTRRWAFGLMFGFIHGFGFAGALSELYTSNSNIVHALFGFNLGVEFGQLVVVAAVIPLIYFIRKQSFYRNVFMQFASIVITFIGLAWTIQRVAA